MRLDELLILLLSVCFWIGVPSFIYFRLKMLKERKFPRYSKRRVLKVTLVNLAINIGILVFFAAILGSLLLSAQQLDSTDLLFTLLFLITMGLIFYGYGLYIAAIVLESYTLPALRNAKAFKIQFIATHLFHGIISHVLIYSGYFIVLLMLSLLEMSTGQGTSLPSSFFLSTGAVSGTMYAGIQVFNGTMPYQFVTAAVVLACLLLYADSSNEALFAFSLSSYLLAFLLSFLFIEALYFLVKGRKKARLWDWSGY